MPMEYTFEYRGDPTMRDKVLRALKRVVDPEMALDIVNLGLVNAVHLDDHTAHAHITMTSPACPVTEMIVEDTRNELFSALGPLYDVHVDVEWDPPWTPERMSESARRALE